MLRKFYEKVLPTQGVYCVTGIDTSNEQARVKNYFADNLEGVFEHIQATKNKNHNVFVALSSFSGFSRKADDAIYCRSFFVDLDVGDDEEKKYRTKEEATSALDKFLESTGLPLPIVVDSGRGIHAYWPFEENVSIEEWKPYAEKFKSYCLENDLLIDRAVTADAARVLRTPYTYNYKEDPPLETSVVSDEMNAYSFEEFKEFLGVIEPSLESILQILPKGDLTDDQKAMFKLDNFETTFERIAIRSLEGDGCAQIAEILTNPNGVSYNMWTAALTIAVKCDDGATAIHKISEDYDGYTYEGTIKKAYEDGLGSPRTCDWFANENPEKCKGCRHRGVITTPIKLGRSLKIATQAMPLSIDSDSGVFKAPTTKQEFTLPEALFPYSRGVTGGIYYVAAPTVDKKGTVIQSNPVQVTQHDVYPIKRVYSQFDKECLIIRAVLPNDTAREFLFPIKYAYSIEKFKEIMTSYGVLFNPLGNGAQYFMNYIVKWGQYLINNQEAEIMRPHMGWTNNETHESFVVGNKEIKRDGTIVNSPTSPLCHEVAKLLTTRGTYEDWKVSANKLNNKTLETHAFTLLCGFGSPLMNFTTTQGVTMAISGESGAAKSGALYAALSVWGNPKGMSIATDEGATKNGFAGRYSSFHNLPFGLDEVGNMDPKILSGLISKISFGGVKIKMQGSINAEREIQAPASLIGIMTANGELYDKLKLNKANPEGEVARLIEFKLNKVPQYLLDHPEEGPNIFDEFNKHYGWAGPEFIKALLKHTDYEISQMIKRWIEKFKADFGNYGPYRYYENLVAVAMTAGDICNEAGILELDIERIYKYIVGQMIMIKDDVVKISDLDYESLVGGYINNNQYSILAISNGKVVMEPKGSLLIRADGDKGLLSINQAAFNKYLNSLQVSSREFLYNMEKLGIKVIKKRVRMGTNWKVVAGLFNDECYQFDSTKFLEKIITEENSEDTGT